MQHKNKSVNKEQGVDVSSRIGFPNGNVAAADRYSIQFGNAFLAVFFRSHGNKSKSSILAGFVTDQTHITYIPHARKDFENVIFVTFKRHITDIQFDISHKFRCLALFKVGSNPIFVGLWKWYDIESVAQFHYPIFALEPRMSTHTTFQSTTSPFPQINRIQ